MVNNNNNMCNKLLRQKCVALFVIERYDRLFEVVVIMKHHKQVHITKVTRPVFSSETLSIFYIQRQEKSEWHLPCHNTPGAVNLP